MIVEYDIRLKVLGDFTDYGFTLEYSDDHMLILNHDIMPIAVFSQQGVTKETIQNECIHHLVMEHGNSWLRKGEEGFNVYSNDSGENG